MKARKILVVALILTIMLAMCTVVKAESSSPTYSATFGLSSSSKLKAGSTVVAKLKIAGLTAGEGIDAILATINYDSNVLEIAGQTSLVGSNNWTVGAYNASTHKVTLTNASKVNAAQDILTITFNVKEDITATSTTVSVKDITVSGGAANDGGTGDISVPNVSVTVQAEAQNTNTNTITEITSTTGTAKTSNSTLKSSKLPQTGVNYLTVSLIIVGFVVLGALCYGRYKNLNKYVK